MNSSKKFNLKVYEHYQGLTPEELFKILIPAIITFIENNQELMIIGITKVHFIDDEVDERRVKLNFCRKIVDNRTPKTQSVRDLVLTESIETDEKKLLYQCKSLFEGSLDEVQ